MISVLNDPNLEVCWKKNMHLNLQYKTPLSHSEYHQEELVKAAQGRYKCEQDLIERIHADSCKFTEQPLETGTPTQISNFKQITSLPSIALPFLYLKRSWNLHSSFERSGYGRESIHAGFWSYLLSSLTIYMNSTSQCFSFPIYRVTVPYRFCYAY